MHPSRIALVVEDEPALQDAMRRRLQAMQLEVLTAFDYRGAVRHLATAVPLIACVDLGLPTESGYEVCEHIRSKPALAGMPIVVASERTFPEDMARAEEAGANAFLRKPYTMAELAQTVEMFLVNAAESRRWVRRLRWT